jgi:hypothetical protein
METDIEEQRQFLQDLAQKRIAAPQTLSGEAD